MANGTADPRHRFVRLGALVRHHEAMLQRVVGEAEEALADYSDRKPPPRELRGIGAVVHDFYTGIERVFESIAPELNGGLPASPSWHRELLETMTLDLPGLRPPLLRTETAHALQEFLRFRHLFRNLYGFELEWSRLRALLERLPTTWAAVQTDLERFVAFLDAAAMEPASGGEP